MEPASPSLLPILGVGGVLLLGGILLLVWRSLARDATHLGGVHPNRGLPRQEPGAQPAETVEDLIRAGNLIEAIKRVRERTGLGLVEAKARVDHFQAHGHWPEANASPPKHPMPAVGNLEELIRQGNMIQAIKLAREQNPGMDLKTAKELVEVLAARMR